MNVRFFDSAFRARSALYNESKTTKVKEEAVILFKFGDGIGTVLFFVMQLFVGVKI